MQRKLAIVLLSIATAAVSWPGAAIAQQAAADAGAKLPTDPAVTVGTLPNGLRYYIRENREPKARAELRLVVNAGSVLEDDDQLGLAHFVEHMAFNGTEHFQKQELIDYMERVGMRFGPDVNAYTSFDETVYMLLVPTDSARLVATAFQILEDWAHGQLFDHEEIDKERGVVVEEWRLGQGAAARMRDEQWPILFKGSRYAERNVIGNEEILRNFDYSVLERFYRDWYRPDLMGVIAVGDFDKSEIEQLIRSHFSGLEMPDIVRERPAFPVPGHDETLFAIASDPEATFNSVNVYWKQPLRDEGTTAAYRQSIVESLYNRMLNARLFELTQQADPPFLGAFSGQGRFIGSTEVYILGAGVPENGIERGLETILTEAERVERFGFTDSELEREKRELLRSIEQAYAEREKTESSSYASEYVRAFLFDEPIPGIAYEYELHKQFVPSITLDEVNRLAKQWIVDTNRVIVVSAPEKEGVKVPSEDELLAVFAAAGAAKVTAYEDAATDAPLVAVVPEPAAITSEEYVEEVGVTVWELANGVRVLLKPTDFKDDEVLIRATSPGGTSLASDDDYIAAATATSVVARGGIGEFSLVDLQKALAGKAVRVSPFIAGIAEGVSGSASPADLETMFQLTYLYFTAPRRDEEAYLSLRSLMDASLANRSADPMSAYRDTAMVTLARYHHRARPPTKELYNEMDLDISYAFYKDRFADASDFTFAIVGAFEPDNIKDLVQTYLGGLPSIGRDETWRDVGMIPPEGVIEKTVYKGIEPKSQTQIVFTGPFDWSVENRYALTSLAAALQIRLREVLREDMGGTYGVRVNGVGSRDPREEYTFSIGFGTAPDRLEEMTAAVFQQIDSVKSYGPTQDDVDKVKETQRRSRETNLRQNSYWLNQLIAYERSGLDIRDILSYDELIETLTPELLQQAAQLYLRTDNYVQISLYPEEQSEGEGN